VELERFLIRSVEVHKLQMRRTALSKTMVAHENKQFCVNYQNNEVAILVSELLGLFWTLTIVLYVEDKKSHNVSETGSVSVLRWMRQDKPTHLGPLERSSLNHWRNPGP
jgi:hypothetical protein